MQRRGGRLRIDVSIRPRHSADSAAKYSLSFIVSTRGPRWRAASGSALRLSAHRPRAGHPIKSLRRSIAAPISRSRFGCADGTRRDAAARGAHRLWAGSHAISSFLRRQRSQLLDGMAGAAAGLAMTRRFSPTDCRSDAGLRAAGKSPGGIPESTPRDHGNKKNKKTASKRSAELRRLFGAEIPALIITDDR